jgi:hypothetical protein
MGIVVSAWTFPGPPPSVETVARELERRVGVPVQVSNRETREDRHRRLDPEGRFESALSGPAEFATLRLPAVCRAYELELGLLERAIAVEAGIPPHPYLWVNLDAALRALGGRRQPAPGAHFPPPGSEHLEKAWAELDRWSRFRFRGPWFLWRR